MPARDDLQLTVVRSKFGPRQRPAAGAGDGCSARRRRLAAITFCGLASLAVAACGVTADGVGTLGIDPGLYSALHCKDLAIKWKELLIREREVRALMDKASEGGGGSVVGALTYRPDYEMILSQKNLMQRTAAAKQCDIPGVTQGTPVYQSDQTIR